MGDNDAGQPCGTPRRHDRVGQARQNKNTGVPGSVTDGTSRNGTGVQWQQADCDIGSIANPTANRSSDAAPRPRRIDKGGQVRSASPQIHFIRHAVS